MCNIIIETIILQGRTRINLFTGLVLKHSIVDKVKFIKNPVFIAEEHMINILETINVTNFDCNKIPELTDINQSKTLNLMRILKNKKINCLIITKNINEFFRYYLNLHNIMILTTKKSTDFNRIKSLTHTKVYYE